MTQSNVDNKNQGFWDELCGSGLAKSIGTLDNSPESIKKFDSAYMGLYPYLFQYLPHPTKPEERILEIGLGYGTVGGILVERGFDYYGLDIAEGPVGLMGERMKRNGLSGQSVQEGSALEIPHPNEHFDKVISIGCLHHTGDLEKCVAEVHRVLAPGGEAVIMLYNRLSYRQLVQAPANWYREMRAEGWNGYRQRIRAMYDTNLEGEAAPHTDYISMFKAHRLFKSFTSIDIDIQNFDHLTLFGGKFHRDRPQLLNNIGRIFGLDLYITLQK
ncbi:MAG: class I SAM-dependent methyltransferase [Acidimicrobiales bacterium]|nr:class I SAM-dependent methyltransferase [Acidimicrobiales bacterium]